MDETALLFIISALPVYLIARHIYKKDKNREPINLLVKLFLSGFVSCIIVFIVSLIMANLSPVFSFNNTNFTTYELIINIFIGIALVEELSKWIMVYSISYNNPEFDEPYDTIVYAVMVSLGFAFLENIFYVYSSGLLTGIIRGLLSVPSHACDAVFMGHFLSKAKIDDINNKSNFKNILLSVLVPTLMHGIYDYLLSVDESIYILMFFIFVIFIYIRTYKKIKLYSKSNNI